VNWTGSPRCGAPCMVVSGHRSELTSNTIVKWQEDCKVEWHYIASPCPFAVCKQTAFSVTDPFHIASSFRKIHVHGVYARGWAVADRRPSLKLRRMCQTGAPRSCSISSITGVIIVFCACNSMPRKAETRAIPASCKGIAMPWLRPNTQRGTSPKGTSSVM
jgi:hypothetical protein